MAKDSQTKPPESEQPPAPPEHAPARAHPVLRAKQQFSAFGQAYGVGDVVDPTLWTRDDGKTPIDGDTATAALQGRIDNGFVGLAAA